jgi:hypothetical protein
LLCHTRSTAPNSRDSTDAPVAIKHESRSHRVRNMPQHHDSAPPRTRCAEKKVTPAQLEEFGFFSGLREDLPADIMLSRFDLTVVIGT